MIVEYYKSNWICKHFVIQILPSDTHWRFLPFEYLRLRALSVFVFLRQGFYV